MPRFLLVALCAALSLAAIAQEAPAPTEPRPAPPAAPQGGPKVNIVAADGEDALHVFVGGEYVTTYYYGDEHQKPFLWPLMSEGGESLTRDYPMANGGEKKFEQDHPHHTSFWTAYGDIDGVDFWTVGADKGVQDAVEVTHESGDEFGVIRSKNVWKKPGGEPMIDEAREYRFYPSPASGRWFDVKVAFTASYGDRMFKGTKEGGIVAARMRPGMSLRNAVITNAQGDKGEPSLWGKPSPWCDFSADLKNVGWRGLTMMDHPKNLRHPSSWHVRAYGLMGANVFGYADFREKDYNKGLPENGDYALKQDERLVFNYRIYLHSGDAAAAKVQEVYDAWASAPVAEWME